MKTFFTNSEGIILTKLLISHFLVDFVLQSEKWVKHKQQKQEKSIFLYLHGLLAGLLAWLFVFQLHNWWIILYVGINHTLIDLWKIKKDKNNSAKFFIIDQAAHIAILISTWALMTKNYSGLKSLFIYLFMDLKSLIVALAYLIAIFPSGYMIGFFTKKWQQGLDHEKDINSPSTGKYIGWLERSLILTFILLNKYEAVGFLLTAKSLLRFRDTDRKLTEYVLVGTLMSLTVTIIIGLLVTFLLK